MDETARGNVDTNPTIPEATPVVGGHRSRVEGFRAINQSIIGSIRSYLAIMALHVLLKRETLGFTTLQSQAAHPVCCLLRPRGHIGKTVAFLRESFQVHC